MKDYSKRLPIALNLFLDQTVFTFFERNDRFNFLVGYGYGQYIMPDLPGALCIFQYARATAGTHPGIQ